MGGKCNVCVRIGADAGEMGQKTHLRVQQGHDTCDQRKGRMWLKEVILMVA